MGGAIFKDNRVLLRLLFLFFLLASPALAEHHLHLEKEYQTAWCNKSKGQMEFLLNDKTRVDCLTKNYAVEVEFASKWAEAIGQALHYARMTGKKPAALIIIERKSDWKHYWQLKNIADQRGVKVWYIKPEDLK